MPLCADARVGAKHREARFFDDVLIREELRRQFMHDKLLAVRRHREREEISSPAPPASTDRRETPRARSQAPCRRSAPCDRPARTRAVIRAMSMHRDHVALAPGIRYSARTERLAASMTNNRSGLPPVTRDPPRSVAQRRRLSAPRRKSAERSAIRRAPAAAPDRTQCHWGSPAHFFGNTASRSRQSAGAEGFPASQSG